jgi:hypothetical protein
MLLILPILVLVQSACNRHDWYVIPSERLTERVDTQVVRVHVFQGGQVVYQVRIGIGEAIGKVDYVIRVFKVVGKR